MFFFKHMFLCVCGVCSKAHNYLRALTVWGDLLCFIGCIKRVVKKDGRFSALNI